MDRRDGLVGRAAPLAALDAAVQSAMARRTGFVLVSGEAGIGKTALMTAAAEHAVEHGAHVLWGQCWESAGAPSYWPWVQVARAAADLVPNEPLPGLARLIDPPDARASPTNESPRARFELFDNVVQLLSTLAEEAPVIVVLDDLQWADEESHALVEHVVRHLHQKAVLLVGAYRDAEAPPRLGSLSALAERIVLGGLDDAAVATLITRVAHIDIGADGANRIRTRTAGNPLFVRELTRLLQARGDLFSAGPAVPVALDSVRETLRRRLARLSPSCREMLDAAAVLGPEIRLDVLAGLLPERAELGSLVDEAIAANVLSRAPRDTNSFAFSHDLFRETIYASLTLDARARIHLACGDVLAELADAGGRPSAAEIAGHFVAASEVDARAARAAARWSQRAAQEALQRLAPEDAVHHHTRALRALETAGAEADVTRIDLLLGLAEGHRCAGDTERSRATYLLASESSRARGDAEGLARAAIGVHGLGAPSGLSHAEPIALLEEAATALADSSGSLRPLTLASLARDLHHSWEEDHLVRARRLAEEAVDLARQNGDRSTLAKCLLALHDTRWLPRSAPQRLEVVEEVLRLGSDAADRDVHALALLLSATARLELGDPGGYHDLVEHCHAADRSGQAHGRWQALSRQATLALIDGDATAARSFSDRAAVLGERIAEPDWQNVADGQLWEIMRFTTGRRRFAEVGRNGKMLAGWPPWVALGLTDDGDLDEAKASLRDFDVNRGFFPGPRNNPEPWSMAIVAEAVAAAGTRVQCREMQARLTPLRGLHVITGGCASYSGAFDHYLGLLAAALGDADAARAHLTDAIAMHDRLGAVAWSQLSQRRRRALGEAEASGGVTELVISRHGDIWELSFGGQQLHLPNLKGLHDIATLVANPGVPIHVMQLLTGEPRRGRTGADAVLDARAKAAFRQRVVDLDAEITEADEHNNRNLADRARAERDALIDELTAAVGHAGRDRRLGDESERARKTVTSRITDARNRMRQQAPGLAQHLDDSISTGVMCCYRPR